MEGLELSGSEIARGFVQAVAVKPGDVLDDGQLQLAAERQTRSAIRIALVTWYREVPSSRATSASAPPERARSPSSMTHFTLKPPRSTRRLT